MSEYNQSQPLVMSSIKIGSYVLTEAELNKFVKLNSYRKIPSEYIGCDVRVNVYTLTEYAALQWIPHPSMGDVAIVYDPDVTKQSYNGTYVYQDPDDNYCISPTSCDVPPNPETHVINIANWKLVNPTISYEDIVKWNNYMEDLGVIRQDIITLRELVGTTETSINALIDNKIALAKTELATDYNNKDDQVRNDVVTLTSEINENKENIRLNARDISDLDTKFDRTIEVINTSVDQKTNLLKNEVDSKIAQHTSEIDGKLAGQRTEFSAADLTLGTRITTEVSGLNDRIDSEVNTLDGKIVTEKTAREAGDTTLNTRITNEVSTLNTIITNKEDALKAIVNQNKLEVNSMLSEKATIGSIASLTSQIGTSSDEANANGSIFARIAALEARIAALENNPTN